MRKSAQPQRQSWLKDEQFDAIKAASHEAAKNVLMSDSKALANMDDRLDDSTIIAVISVINRVVMEIARLPGASHAKAKLTNTSMYDSLTQDSEYQRFMQQGALADPEKALFDKAIQAGLGIAQLKLVEAAGEKRGVGALRG